MAGTSVVRVIPMRTDATYAAMLTDNELIERAHYYPSADLCSALVQRVSAVRDEAVANFKEEISDLEQSLSDKEEECSGLEEDLAAAERKIEELEAKLEALDAGEDG
jgi:septal ring factor EnvC (AmiA/AmiB activator)